VAFSETAAAAVVAVVVMEAEEVPESACEATLELCWEAAAGQLNCALGEVGVPEQTVGMSSSSLR
jgi:hypothetical protein